MSYVNIEDKDGRYYFVKDGQLLEPSYDYIYQTEYNYLVCLRGKWGCANWQGKITVPIEYDYIHYPYRDFIVASKGPNSYGVVKNDGTPLTKFVYDAILVENEQDGIVPVFKKYQKKLYGFIDISTGIEISKPSFESIDKFFNGYCSVFKNGKWGAINRKGNLVVPFKYLTSFRFFDDFAIVWERERLYIEEDSVSRLILKSSCKVIYKNGTEILKRFDGIKRIGPATYRTIEEIKGIAHYHTYQLIVKPRYIVVIKDAAYMDILLDNPTTDYEQCENAKYLDGGTWYAIDFYGNKINLDQSVFKQIRNELTNK